jgi:hypothetical protein
MMKWELPLPAPYWNSVGIPQTSRSGEWQQGHVVMGGANNK